MDKPHADSVAWTKSPEQMPKVVSTPSRRPPRRTLRITSMVSGPGAIVRTAAAQVNAITCASPMFSPFAPASLDRPSSTLTPNAALHLHQGAEQRDAYHKRTALPGVKCKRMLGADWVVRAPSPCDYGLFTPRFRHMRNISSAPRCPMHFSIASLLENATSL